VVPAGCSMAAGPNGTGALPQGGISNVAGVAGTQPPVPSAEASTVTVAPSGLQAGPSAVSVVSVPEAVLRDAGPVTSHAYWEGRQTAKSSGSTSSCRDAPDSSRPLPGWMRGLRVRVTDTVSSSGTSCDARPSETSSCAVSTTGGPHTSRPVVSTVARLPSGLNSEGTSCAP